MIYLHENGVTVVAQTGAKGAKAGETYELNGDKYYVAIDRFDLRRLIEEGADMSKVVTSKITTMNHLFYNSSFNQDISSWDTSRVKSMSNMFMWNEVFNQPIGNWNTKNVTAMMSMFEGAISFNQPIGEWDTCRLYNISNMFENAKSFNQPIENWDVSQVAHMLSTFKGAISFNQSLSKWNFGAVAPRMFSLFEGAKSFNGNLRGWKLNGSLTSLFKGAESFNQPLDSWDVSNVDSMKSLFEGAKSFNQDISKWDTSSLYSTENMFYGASSFNQDIGIWNVGCVTNMKNMFREASLFNQNIGRWNVSKVRQMTGLFQDASSFNQDIRNWKLNDAIKKSRTMFLNATSFKEEFNPFNNADVNKFIVEKPKKVDTSVKLSAEDKKTISKIKKFLVSRDLDKIDLGIELLISLNNDELFESLLHDCKITYSEKNDGKNELVRNKIFKGSGPAQPYLDYALINVIANAPENVKKDETLMLKNITSFDTSMLVFPKSYFSLSFPRFIPIEKFHSLSNLKINLSDFRLEEINLSEVFKNENITSLEISNVEGSLKWLNNFPQLKNLDLNLSLSNYPLEIEYHDSFYSLENLEYLKLVSVNNENLSFLNNCKNLKELNLHIKSDFYGDTKNLKNLDFLENLINLEKLSISGLHSKINVDGLMKCKNIKQLSIDVYSEGFNFKSIEGCKSLEYLNLGDDISNIDLKGEILEIGKVKVNSNLSKFSSDSTVFSILNHKKNLKEKSNEIIKADESLVSDGIIKLKKNNYTVNKLSSELKKSFNEVKKLLVTRDLKKIDEGINLLISLNEIEIFETLLDGCELSYDNVYQYESKLITNNLFTGTGPAQPFLNYALFCVIANCPQDAKIESSLLHINLTKININVFLSRGILAGHDVFPPVLKFSHLDSLTIDFDIFSKWGKEAEVVNKLDRKDWFKGNNIKNLNILSCSGSLKWLKNFSALKTLNYKYDYLESLDYESFEYLTDLEELELRNIKNTKNLDFIKNSKKLKKLTLYFGGSYRDDVEFEDLNVLNNFRNLQELVIRSISTNVNIGSISNCLKIKKLTIDFSSREREKLGDYLDSNLFENCKNLELFDVTGVNQINLKANITDLNGLNGLNKLKKLKIGNFIIHGIDDKVFIN